MTTKEAVLVTGETIAKSAPRNDDERLVVRNDDIKGSSENVNARLKIVILILSAAVFLSLSLIPLPQGYCQEEKGPEGIGPKNAAESSFLEETVEEFRKKRISAQGQSDCGIMTKTPSLRSAVGAEAIPHLEIAASPQPAASAAKQAPRNDIVTQSECGEDIPSKGTSAQLKKEIILLQDSFKKERAKFYQELGTAYTKAKFFDLAIESYLQSLVFEPSNARVHYNLGLLYKSAKDDVKKSLFYFKKYLKLKPDAENRRDVEYMMKMMEPELGDR